MKTVLTIGYRTYLIPNDVEHELSIFARLLSQAERIEVHSRYGEIPTFKYAGSEEEPITITFYTQLQLREEEE